MFVGGFKMSGIIISKVKYFSLAKFLAMYGFLFTCIYVIVDLLMKAISGKSILIQSITWGDWVIGAVIQLILAPIGMFIVGYILGFIINLCLKVSKGLEFETL